jgi:hypothetical protein
VGVSLRDLFLSYAHHSLLRRRFTPSFSLSLKNSKQQQIPHQTQKSIIPLRKKVYTHHSLLFVVDSHQVSLSLSKIQNTQQIPHQTQKSIITF